MKDFGIKNIRDKNSSIIGIKHSEENSKQKKTTNNHFNKVLYVNWVIKRLEFKEA